MMKRYVSFIVRHRIAVVVGVLIVTIFFATELRHLRLEINRRANLPQDHPYVQVQNRISDLFGGEAVVIIGIVANQGTVFTPEILGKVFRITEGLRRTTGIVEASLFSLAAPSVKAVVEGSDGAMDVHAVMETAPVDLNAAEAIRATVRGDGLFRRTLVSADEAATVIVAEFDDHLTDRDVAQRVEALVGPERDSSVTIALAGAPILRSWLSHYTGMIAILFPIAVLVIGLIHYEAFRTAQAMILPLATALLSVVWALGMMGLVGQPMDTWSAITPVVILAVAAGHAVQILKRYYEEYARVRDNDEAVIRSITAVGPVMLTAGLIAATGFASLVGFGISSVRAFGLLMASGILSALAIEMTFTPACRSLLPPPRRHEMLRERGSHWLGSVLDRLSQIVISRPTAVLLAGGAVVVVAALGVLSLQVDNSFRLWFSPSTQIRHDDALLNEKLPGTASLRLLIEGREPNDVLEPPVLSAVSDLEDFLASDPHVGGVTSIADHVKRMHQAMNQGNPAFYAVPDNERLINQYVFLYGMSAGPDGLSAFIDADNQRAVIRALSKTDSAVFSHDLIEKVRSFVEKRFAGLPVAVGIAGGTLGVQTAMNDVVVHDKIVNMLQVGIIIFALSAVVFRSLVGGLFVLLPLAVAVIVNLGIMGWTHTWLDMTTAAINAMGVSIGADFAIYLLSRIREEMVRADGDTAVALSATLQTSGKAVFFVSSAVALGYLVLPFAGFSLWTRLGVLTATIIATSALATLTLIPALSLVFAPRFLSSRVVRREPAWSRTEKAA